jgi:hypothetical protein
MAAVSMDLAWPDTGAATSWRSAQQLGLGAA